MPSTSLAGRSILIVEDEPLIALEIVTAFQNAGAVALTARSLPYVLYTGYEQADDGCANITVVRKPANAQEIVAAVEQLLRPRSGS